MPTGEYYSTNGRTIVKRNANAFSLNVVVDARLRRRHEMIFLVSQKLRIRASDFKIHHKVASIVFTL